MCAANWLVGQVLLGTLLPTSDLENINEQKVSLGSVVAFLGLMYFDVMFTVYVAKRHLARAQTAHVALIAGAGGPAVVYAVLVAYLIVKLNPSMLPLVLTADAAMVLSLPVLHAVALGPKLFPSHASHEVRAAGSFSSNPPREHFLAPRLVYAALLIAFCGFAAPNVVAVLMSTAPSRVMKLQEILRQSPGIMQIAVGSHLTSVLASVEQKSQHVTAVLGQEVRLSVKQIIALCGLIAAPFMLLNACFMRSRKEKPSTTNATARRRLTKLRAASKLFPPPYANGWYFLCQSDEVPKDRAIAKSACNKEFAVFRGDDGKVAVLHAFCPHLGTHLGEGGKVINGAVVCPYHSWTFNKDGKCIDIPYCPKTPGDRTHTTAYHVRERLGLVFVWLHAEGAEPFYELTLLDDIEEKNMVHVGDRTVDNWQMHLMEPSQNAADPYHFNTTHSWVGGGDDGRGGWLWVRHECSSRLALLGGKEKDGKTMQDTMVAVDEACAEMWLFGIIPLPGFLNSHYSSGATFQGPGVSIFRVDTPMLGSVRIIVTFTPEAPFEQRSMIRSFCSPGFPKFLARWMTKMGVATINQDRKVWENKLAIAPRNVVAGDGPFAAYGTWLRQFYSENSQSWGDQSLDW